MNYFNQNIRFIRRKRGESQEDFAKFFGIKRHNIASYEQGTQPGVDTVVKIGLMLGLNLDAFLKEEMKNSNYDSFFVENKPPDTQSGESASYRLISLVQELRSTDPDEKRREKVADEACRIVGYILDEISSLKSELLHMVKYSHKKP